MKRVLKNWCSVGLSVRGNYLLKSWDTFSSFVLSLGTEREIRLVTLDATFFERAYTPLIFHHHSSFSRELHPGRGESHELAEECNKKLCSSRTHHSQLLKAQTFLPQNPKNNCIIFFCPWASWQHKNREDKDVSLSHTLCFEFSQSKRKNPKPYYMSFWKIVLCCVTQYQVTKKKEELRLSEYGEVFLLKRTRAFAQISALE